MKKQRLCTLLLMLCMWASTHATAQCVVSREEVLSLLAQGVSSDMLAKKLDGCVAEELIGSPVSALEEQTIKNTGSVFYEAITSCGYHPQRKELTCPIEIRQPFGYSGVPALQPAGSYEYVLFCIESMGSLVPVNTNGVHVHDESFGNTPNWYTTAVVPANGATFSRPLVGQTLRARAILSWAVPPAGCNAVPVWGNQADFRIRLDP